MSGFTAHAPPADRHCGAAGSDAAEDLEAVLDLPESPASPPLWLSEEEETQGGREDSWCQEEEEVPVCGQ